VSENSEERYSASTCEVMEGLLVLPKRFVCLLAIFLIGLIVPPLNPCLSIEDPRKGLADVGVESKLGQKINLDAPFIDAEGKKVTLRQYFHDGLPVIITPVYYRCPRICGLLLEGLTQVMEEMKLTLGVDYRVISVSFDPSEGVAQAQARAGKFRNSLSRGEKTEANWPFLTGPKESSYPLMKELGFKFAPDEGEFAHSPVIMILTPQGEVSQYFTDVRFSAWDTRLALVEASQGKIGSPIDHILLFCFRFDPRKGKYTWAAYNFMRFGTVSCVVLCVLLVVRQIRRNVGMAQ
jgi:protein SCO1/2